ncbi:MAG: hypothetical protein J0L55_10525 [Caulobacterales bacterium]|nr:hypothetical protein [Caulobacterales bacterium]MCA0372765.1 hypothetical protein [Pseudomonadota bacterium]
MLNRRGLIQSTIGIVLLSHNKSFADETHDYKNLMPEFFKVWDKSKSSKNRAKFLKMAFFDKNKTLYDALNIGIKENDIEEWLIKFTPFAEDVRNLSQSFAKIYDAHNTKYKKYFPDFDHSKAKICLMPSMLNFDGRVPGDLKPLTLYFGADGIIVFHGKNANLELLLDHESYHLYQGQVRPKESYKNVAPPIYNAMWMEGTATYVSHALNPSATRLEVLLGDKNLDNIGPEEFRKCAQYALDNIDSNKDEDYARFFQFNWKGEFPSRGGYLLGYLAAKEASKNLSLAQMAKINSKQVREIIKNYLETTLKV